LIAGAVAATVALGVTGGAVAFAVGGDDDDETPVTGRTANRAIAAAVAETGGGRANSVERDSEDGATYEVEVTKRDGGSVDVRLDAGYKVVIVEDDSEAPDDGD
jgi:uncharacterized membrane protein YkoI